MVGVISYATLAIIVVLICFGMINSILMLAHLRGGNRELAKAIMMGPFCPREVFTDVGWQYRTRATWAATTALVLLLLWSRLP